MKVKWSETIPVDKLFIWIIVMKTSYDIEPPLALRLASTTGWAKQRGVRAFEVWREITCVGSEALLPQVYVSDALV